MLASVSPVLRKWLFDSERTHKAATKSNYMMQIEVKDMSHVVVCCCERVRRVCACGRSTQC